MLQTRKRGAVIRVYIKFTHCWLVWFCTLIFGQHAIYSYILWIYRDSIERDRFLVLAPEQVLEGFARTHSHKYTYEYTRTHIHPQTVAKIRSWVRKYLFDSCHFQIPSRQQSNARWRKNWQNSKVNKCDYIIGEIVIYVNDPPHWLPASLSMWLSTRS